MNVLSQFSLPYRGLGNGEHKFQFEVTDEFFEKFENSDFKRSNFLVDLLLDKKTDHCLLTFQVKGNRPTVCDRCTADILFPVEGTYHLHVKFAQGDGGGDTDEIVFMGHDTTILDVSVFVYEYIVLSLPLITTCDAIEDSVCDEVILKHLKVGEDSESNEDSVSPWDSLKGIDFNK